MTLEQDIIAEAETQLQSALAHQQAGRLREAEVLYQQILQKNSHSEWVDMEVSLSNFFIIYFFERTCIISSQDINWCF